MKTTVKDFFALYEDNENLLSIYLFTPAGDYITSNTNPVYKRYAEHKIIKWSLAAARDTILITIEQ